jgi:hypothetical protein
MDGSVCLMGKEVLGGMWSRGVLKSTDAVGKKMRRRYCTYF